MQWTEGEIEGVQVRPAVKHADRRGWLAEMFRSDEIAPEILPVMSYVSVTHAGCSRGPHGHWDQTDFFGFVGPGTFKLKLWDNRPASPTYGRRMSLVVGENSPMVVAIPPGVVHGYANISDRDGWVLNFPNRLFTGRGRRDPVDEIRYEEQAGSAFSMDD
jgi:dTDP-4-dehydrorhamnose 3,5-epimerase